MKITIEKPDQADLTFPFVWRGKSTGRIYIRVSSYKTPVGMVDVLLRDTNPPTYCTGVGVLVPVLSVSDEEAWSQRLAGAKVTFET